MATWPITNTGIGNEQNVIPPFEGRLLAKYKSFYKVLWPFTLKILKQCLYKENSFTSRESFQFRVWLDIYGSYNQTKYLQGHIAITI